jgi:membrane-associated phospholipid phosphatase
VTVTPVELDASDARSAPARRVNAQPPAGSIARVIGLGFPIVAATLIAVGLLVTNVLDGTALVRWDQRVVVDLAAHRTTSQTRLSAFWSKLADAPSIIVVALIVMIVLAVARRWREIVWVGVVLATELALFLTVSSIVGRVRPDVAHLGSVPSTGSFPSGHIAVTVAFYGTVATLIRLHMTGKAASAARWCALVWMASAAVFVGWARLYRGMHHPLDVLAGAALGLAVWWLGVRAFTEDPPRHKEFTK